MILSTQLKAFLLVAGGTTAAATTAYVTGALDRFMVEPPAAIAALPQSASSQPLLKADPKTDRMQPANPAAPQVPAPQASDAPAKEVIAPSFDVVRVEPDGSIVVAGRAAPNATVELLTGSKVLGQTKASAGGDFAIVLDDRLDPGGYQLVLRSTADDKLIAMSPETAVVSVPEQPGGQVLALVEKPGQPSKLIAVPEPGAAQSAKPAEAKPAAVTPAEAKPAEVASAPATTPQPVAPAAEAAKPAAEAPAVEAGAKPSEPAETVAQPTVKVEAVEIEGKKVFVAGTAKAGSLVRVYANNVMLGEALASPGGRFLVEAMRDLPVGGYIIRADELGADGVKVVARAEVPFEREAGQSVAAVAQPQQPADAGKAAPTDTVAAADPVVPQSGMKLDAAPPSVTAPMLQSVDGAVIIRRGDTLWRISRRVYGMGVRYSTIYLANQDQISDPDRIWPGQVFAVPQKTDKGEAADMDAIADQKPPADAKTASAPGHGPKLD